MIEIRRLKDPSTTLGVALHFLSQRDPFASFPARELVATVDGQIRRGTYLLALKEMRVVGYLGWALFDEATAADFARTMMAPSSSLIEGGDVVWVLTAAAIESTKNRGRLGSLDRLGSMWCRSASQITWKYRSA
jgi:hemolysin-activating ACP:hemolysin acyltransferase